MRNKYHTRYGTLQPKSSQQHYRDCPSGINQYQTACCTRSTLRIYFGVCNPSRPCLSHECESNLNQNRSLSYSYVSPNQTRLPSVSVKIQSPLHNRQISYVQSYTYQCALGGRVQVLATRFSRIILTVLPRTTYASFIRRAVT